MNPIRYIDPRGLEPQDYWACDLWPEMCENGNLKPGPQDLYPMEPPGTCSWAKYTDLRGDYRYACGKSPGLTPPSRCNSSMSCEEILETANEHRKCYMARTELMDNCFKGGDVNHRKQAYDVMRGWHNCLAEYRDNCSPSCPAAQ